MTSFVGLQQRISNVELGCRDSYKEIGASEAQDSEDWAEKIGELGEKRERLTSALLTDLRLGLMMSILGTRGFFEWAIIAEDESVEDLAILAGNLTDRDASATWSRIAADERLHIERMRWTRKKWVGSSRASSSVSVRRMG
jgi:rubrerythrin